LRLIKVEFSAEVSDDLKDMRLIQELMKAVDISTDGVHGKISKFSVADCNDVNINIDRKAFWEMVDAVADIKYSVSCLECR